MQDDGGSGSFRFFEDEDELRRLCVDAGFPRAGVEVRREGRGCAIIKCVVPLEAEAAAEEEEAEAAEAAAEAAEAAAGAAGAAAVRGVRAAAQAAAAVAAA